VSQCTAQVVMEAVLEASLNKEDLVFFKEVAKRALVLFLVYHAPCRKRRSNILRF
jgi:hypothetical protein